MEDTSGNSGRTRSRIIIRGCIAIAVACLVMQAIEVRVIHHSLPLTILGMAAPVVSVLCSLYYLHSTRERP